ncbi:MAG: G5 domain-containing protein, partial [Bacilli bacterium]
MNKKNTIITIIAILLATFTLFINFNNKTKDPQEVYRVYLEGKSIGLINSKIELENYIDSEQKQLKDVYKVDKVYQPKNLEVIKEVTYENNISSTNTIYNKIKNDSPFTINGYKIVISGVKEKAEDGKETTTPTITIYTLNKEMFTNAVSKTITAFVDPIVYQKFLNGEKQEKKDIGRTTEDIYIENNISIKKDNIPVNEKIYTNEEELTRFLLFGTLDDQKEYIVKTGDTINDVAFANKISPQEFLVANPKFKSENNLLFPGQKVTLGILKPSFKTTEEVSEIKIQDIPYKTEIEYDNNLLLGTEYVKQNGETGLQKVTSKIKYVNGESVSAFILPGSEEIKPTISRVIVKGGRSGVLGEVGYWGWPTNTPYIITSYFAWRWGVFHDGLD